VHFVPSGPRRFFSPPAAMRSALILAGLPGMFGLSVTADQISSATTPAPTARIAPTGLTIQTTSWLSYRRGNFSLVGGWRCHGWSDDLAHCAPPVQRAVSRQIRVAPKPIPSAKPAPPVAGTTPNTQAIINEILSVFGQYGNQAVNVARCESGFNPNAVNPSSHASGLFQFLWSTWNTTSYASDSPFNASANIHAAYQVFARDDDSWREWSCQP
jgi:hypothetical protein